MHFETELQPLHGTPTHFSDVHIRSDTLAQCEIFTSVTSLATFPLKFVAHRWVENVPVIQTAIEIMPSLKQHVKAVDEKKTKESWHKVVPQPEGTLRRSVVENPGESRSSEA